jgi:hypothetical protein
MGDSVREFTALVMLMSAAYVVLSNLHFRRQWPQTAARQRKNLASVVPAAADINVGGTMMFAVASCAGAFAGGFAGLLIYTALDVLLPHARIDHSIVFGFGGAVLGAALFAIVAERD